MSDGFVLGNGVSRKGIPSWSLRRYGRIYGCNALYRDFTPDVLVATDGPIAKHIQDSGYSRENRFYTRKPQVHNGAKTVPHYNFSSGPNAVSIAAADGCQPIYLIGFDMAPEDNKFNNVYAGTQFYKPSGSEPTYAGNWIGQLLHVFDIYPFVQFYRVLGKTTQSYPELLSRNNYEEMTIDNFLDGINNR